MNNSKIIEITLKVFKECAVQSFPIDCLRLLRYYGYKIYTYQELSRKNRELHEMCMGFSEDAFQDGHSMIIAYNQDRPKGRIRFSLMHELGHCLLGHAGISQSNEQEANAFASNILAPAWRYIILVVKMQAMYHMCLTSLMRLPPWHSKTASCGTSKHPGR